MGFDSFRDLMRAQTVLGDSKQFAFQKTQVTAGALVASAYYDFYESGTEPAANTLPTGSNAFKVASGNNGAPTLGGVSVNGFNFVNPSAGKTRHLLYTEGYGDVASSIGTLYFYDVLGAYCDFNQATAGNIATGTGAGAADITRYTDGKDCKLLLVGQVLFTGTAANIVVNYTNGALASKSTPSVTPISGCVRGRYLTNAWSIPLAAGDDSVVAVRSVDHSGGAAPVGKYAIFIAKLLGTLTIDTAQLRSEKSFSNPNGAFLFPQLQSNCFLGMSLQSGNTPTTPTWRGNFTWCDGANPT